MSEEVYTVEHVAERLKLHRKTVLRMIRDGRLRAARVGKAYRILRSDLEALAGTPARPEGPATTARTTAIVDVEGVGGELAQRISTYLTSARMGREAAPDPMNVNVVHDPARRALKVVIQASPADAAGLLALLDFHLRL
jgi:excisionase family DNA binding protein